MASISTHRRYVRTLLLACFFATTSALAQSPPVVTAAHPIVREIVEDDEFVGRFEAVAEVHVRSRVDGYLEAVHFTDGAMVETGDLLFTIDQRRFRTAFRQAEAQFDVAQAALDFATEQFNRASQLVNNGTIPQSVFDQRREAFLGAQGELERTRAARDAAQIDLEYSEIKAPMAGRIARRLITPGNLVQANQTVLTSIVAIDPIHFYFDIDERYYLAYARDARVRSAWLQEGGGGVEVQVSLADRLTEPRKGVLDFSDNRLDNATGSMRVRAVVENGDGVLQPGLFGRVNVPGSLPHIGVLIPDEAIVADQNRQLVMVVDREGLVSPRLVRPGPRIDGYRVIREGLDGSEIIVTEGLLRARPGSVVAPELVELPPVPER